MTYNKFSSGGLFNQVSNGAAEAKERGGAAKFIGVFMALALLAALGAGFWFLQG